MYAIGMVLSSAFQAACEPNQLVWRNYAVHERFIGEAFLMAHYFQGGYQSAQRMCERIQRAILRLLRTGMRLRTALILMSYSKAPVSQRVLRCHHCSPEAVLYLFSRLCAFSLGRFHHHLKKVHQPGA